MNSKHTPGPWAVEGIPKEAHTDPDMLIPEDDLFWIVDTKQASEVIATVGRTARGDAEANARLMAMAPSMVERLKLIETAALNRIDGDSQPHDTHWSEIVGIACGEVDWLHRAKVNYEPKHARLVQLCKGLLESAIDGLDRHESHEHIAACIADQIEEAILPEMVIGEDGRNFLRGQGQPYPRVEVTNGKA